MGAGDGLVHDGEDVPGRGVLPQKLGEILCVLLAVCVGDADDLVARIDRKVGVALGQGLDGPLSAALLLDADDLPLLVALQKGLDLEHHAHNGGGVGEPAGAL